MALLLLLLLLLVWLLLLLLLLLRQHHVRWVTEECLVLQRHTTSENVLGCHEPWRQAPAAAAAKRGEAGDCECLLCTGSTSSKQLTKQRPILIASN
jgi:hypothetical protein